MLSGASQLLPDSPWPCKQHIIALHISLHSSLEEFCGQKHRRCRTSLAPSAQTLHPINANQSAPSHTVNSKDHAEGLPVATEQKSFICQPPFLFPCRYAHKAKLTGADISQADAIKIEN